MNRKQTIAIVSSSALAAGMAQGAVLYSGLVNTTVGLNGTTSFDLNGDGPTDFTIGFNLNDAQKPFITGNVDAVPGASPLGQLVPVQNGDNAYALPITPFGTLIDSNYLAAVPDLSSDGDGTAWMNVEDVDGKATTIAAWGNNSITEAYVGLEMYDNSGLSQTNFGWVRLILNNTAQTLTVVDYGYETIVGEGILAGQTNELGAPNIYSGPSSQAVPVGSAVQLSVQALGIPTLAYQWRAGAVGHGVFTNLTNAGNISGATNATLTISGLTPANMADYDVVITNTLGGITSSPPATLTVVAPIATPTPQVLFGGLTAQFNVSVSGLSPTFRWQKSGVNLSNGGRISGATNATLQISNLQTTDSANYAAVLTSGSLVVTSTASALTVLPVSSESTYDLAVLAAGPVAYYRFNETGNPATNNLLVLDNAAALNGIYGVDVTNGYDEVAGPRPTDGYPGFPANNAAALFTANDTNSQITVAPWNLNSASVTFTFWVNAPVIQNYSAAIISSGTNNSTYAAVNYYSGFNPGGTGVGISGDIDLGYTWNEAGSPADIFWDSGIMPPTNDWSFVALEIESSNTVLYVFNADETNTWDQGTFPAFNVYPGNNGIAPFVNQVMAFNTPETIGNNPSQPGGAYGFDGVISDMAVFNQVLSQNQLTAMYNAALGIPPGPSIALVGTSVQITWPLGTLVQSTSLHGPWTAVPSATSPYTVPPSSPPSTYYRVLLY